MTRTHWILGVLWASTGFLATSALLACRTPGATAPASPGATGAPPAAVCARVFLDPATGGVSTAICLRANGHEVCQTSQQLAAAVREVATEVHEAIGGDGSDDVERTWALVEALVIAGTIPACGAAP